MTNKPQTVTWVLVAFGVLVLLIVFFMMRSSSDGDRAGLDQDIVDCERNLAAAYEGIATATPTPQMRADLQALVDRCADVIEEARE